MTPWRRWTALLLLPCAPLLPLWLAACAGAPVPDWQLNARGALDRAAAAYLVGDRRVEAAEFARARADVARTGRADLLATLELARCAWRVASLAFDDDGCPGYDALAADAGPAERAYADYLAGRVNSAADVALLPAPQRQAASVAIERPVAAHRPTALAVDAAAAGGSTKGAAGAVASGRPAAGAIDAAANGSSPYGSVAGASEAAASGSRTSGSAAGTIEAAAIGGSAAAGGAAGRAVAGIDDPLSRLVAAGVLLRRGAADPAVLTTAIATASAQGWSRPLLAWLHAERLRAQAAGDADAAARIGRRIALIAPLSPAGSAPAAGAAAAASAP